MDRSWNYRPNLAIDRLSSSQVYLAILYLSSNNTKYFSHSIGKLMEKISTEEKRPLERSLVLDIVRVGDLKVLELYTQYIVGSLVQGFLFLSLNTTDHHHTILSAPTVKKHMAV
jgi:hypothetical protein